MEIWFRRSGSAGFLVVSQSGSVGFCWVLSGVSVQFCWVLNSVSVLGKSGSPCCAGHVLETSGGGEVSGERLWIWTGVLLRALGL